MTTIHEAPAHRRRQADGLRLQGRRRGRRHPQHRPGRAGRQARLLPGDGRSGPTTPAQLAAGHRHRRALRPGVAQRPGRRWLRRVRRHHGSLHPAARAGGRADRPEQPGIPARLLPDRPGHHARHRQRARRRPATRPGVGWHEHHADVHDGCERFFRTMYNAHLVGEWLPALDGVVDKLERGATVADIGCGHGASTIIMAQAFPNSTFVGSDYHEASIATARQRAQRRRRGRPGDVRGGLGDRSSPVPGSTW